MWAGGGCLPYPWDQENSLLGGERGSFPHQADTEDKQQLEAVFAADQVTSCMLISL